VRILLDTDVWLWMISAGDRLTDEARDLFQDEETDLFLSAAAVWEIGIKHAAGKLKFSGQPAVQIPPYIKRSGVQPLAISVGHALRASSLPPHHRDPFDRMMVAQALEEDLTLATVDQQLAAYGVPLLQAGA